MIRLRFGGSDGRGVYCLVVVVASCSEVLRYDVEVAFGVDVRPL